MPDAFGVFVSKFTQASRLAGILLLALFAAAQPGLAKSGDWEFQRVWYVPRPSTDIDEAAKTVTNMQPLFATYGGMTIDHLVITREGIAVHGSQTIMQQQSRYVPTYGGSWVGGTYVPYYGGTTVTQQVPVSTHSQAYISYPDLVAVQLLYFPKLRFSWGAHFVHRDSTKNVTLRTSDEGLARQMADAVVTLAVPRNEQLMGNQSLDGIFGSWDDAKAAKKAGWKGVGGFYVQEVAAGSPAERSGLQAGDFIFEANGQPVQSSKGLYGVLGNALQTDLDLALDLRVLRKKQEVPVRLVASNTRLAHWLALHPPKLGIRLRDASAQELTALGFTTQKGAIVDGVIANSLAQRMDFRRGDWLLELNNQPQADQRAILDFVATQPIRTARVLRDGAMVELRAPPNSAADPAPKFGVSLRTLPAAAGKLPVLEVVRVEPDSPASKMLLATGDQLLEVNGQPVGTTEEFAAILTRGPVNSAKVLRSGKEVSLGPVTSF